MDDQYKELYRHGQMINDCIYGHFLYNFCLSNAGKLKPGQIVQIFKVEIVRATRKEIAEHIF